jgi:hypothetical protein
MAALQMPKVGLHPTPQYSDREPQYPNFEQQLPYAESLHVYPFEPPQLPLGEIFFPNTGGVAGGDVVHLPCLESQPFPQWAAVLPHHP